MKIKYNDGLEYLFNWITTSKQKLTFTDVFQEAVNNKIYVEFYIHLKVIMQLLEDHNNKF